MYKEMHGVFEVIEDAIDAAYEAQRILEANYTTEDRQKFIDAVKAEALKVVNEETIKEFEETGYGRLDQKLVKNYGSIAENPGVESLKHEVLASGKGVTIDFAAPYGTVGALTPVTNGLVTVVCNTLSMLAAGNTIVFNAHPAGKESACKACDLVNRAIVEAGGPDNVCTMIADPTYETLDVIMASDKIKMLIGTGGEGMVAKLMSSSKKVIAAGPGNPPAVIDETANVKQAAQVLYEMVPFENNMLCITEKEAFVVESVYDEFVEAMKECGARVLTEEEAQKVIDLCIAPNAEGKLMPNKKFVGKNANVILKAAGLEVDESVDLQLAVILTDSVDHPYVMCEQLMPIFPICKVKDWDAAMAAAIKAEAGCHHSACVWTASLERATALGKALGCTCFAMNGPTVGGTGMMGTGYGSPTIAVSTGEGFTTPNTFTRFRRFAMCQGAAYMG